MKLSIAYWAPAETHKGNESHHVPPTGYKRRKPDTVHSGMTDLGRVVISISLFTVLVKEAAGANVDLRANIQEGKEPCFQYFPNKNLFRMNCSILNWEEQGYGDDTHISLEVKETFDGGGSQGNIIDLKGIEDFYGLFTVAKDGENIASLNEAPLIRHVHVKHGTTASSGGFVIRKYQKYFIVDSCSATGDITDSAGGICGHMVGHNEGHIKISHSYSTGTIKGSLAGGITGDDTGYDHGTVNITQCYSTGTIKGGKSGGTCGRDAARAHGHVYITQSYSTGNIIGSHSGGIVGDDVAHEYGDLHIIDCYTRGNIRGSLAGGITGESAGGYNDVQEATGDIYIINTYASGAVNRDDAGGLIGDIDGSTRGVIKVHYSVYNDRGGAGQIVGRNQGNVLETVGISGNLDDIRGQLYHHGGVQQWDNEAWAVNGRDALPILRFQLVDPTPTPSPSTTSAATPTPSTTPSKTSTLSSSPSRSVTPTPSFSPTTSASSSKTPSASVSPSQTPTSTATPSPTASLSTTPSSSSSRTETRTSSVSGSSTASTSTTGTPSGSTSMTPSWTPTRSPPSLCSCTSTPSSSNSETVTLTLTPCPTRSTALTPSTPTSPTTSASRSSIHPLPKTQDGKSANAGPVMPGVAQWAVISAVSVIISMAVAFILYRRSRNRNMSKFTDDPKKVYAAQLGIPSKNVKVMFPDRDGNAAFHIHSLSVDDENMELAHVNPLNLPTNRGESSSGQSNPSSVNTRPSQTQFSYQSHTVAPTVNSGEAPVTVANGAKTLGRASVEPPQIVFVEPRGQSLSSHRVRIVSSAAPSIQRVHRTRSRGESCQVKVASIVDLDTTSMKRIERLRLRLRQWKSKVLAEPPPLVELEVDSVSSETNSGELSSNAAASSDSGSGIAQLKFAKPDVHAARNTLSEEKKNDRCRQPRIGSIGKKEFTPVPSQTSRSSARSGFTSVKQKAAGSRRGKT
eukprot:gb/GECG01004441.1/.p1 GENE.gb/GECG01004441.1/~~gb/GECG01004441.1/.p1  ORF type:complete len:965 (+),score=116.82 gb/GECG01004441.1/:1-2895(+)